MKLVFYAQTKDVLKLGGEKQSDQLNSNNERDPQPGLPASEPGALVNTQPVVPPLVRKCYTPSTQKNFLEWG